MKHYTFRNLAFKGLTFSVLAFSSCDKVNNPYISKGGTGTIPVVQPTRVDSTRSNASDDLMRKILVEDYSGHLCINCPTLSNTLDNFFSTDAKANQGILVTINASNLAIPNQSPYDGSPAGAYKNDFRTTAGNEWFDNFIQVAVPGDMVDRIYCANPPVQGGEQDFFLNGRNTINAQFDSLAVIAPTASIHIVDSMYAPPTNTLSMTLTTKITSPQAGCKYYLVVMLIEDSIYDYQDSMHTNNPYYLHKMFLRDNINDGGHSAGDSLAFNNLPQIKHYVYTSTNFAYNTAPINPYNLAVPVTSWNMAHMYIVAFIYQTTSATVGDYQILQAQRLHI